MNLTRILIMHVVLVVMAMTIFSQPTKTILKPPVESRSPISIGVTVNAVGDGERFEFSIGGGRKVTITRPGVVVNFPGDFLSRQNYTVTQFFGPRGCRLTNHVGTVANANIVVNADCGLPPISATIGVTVNAVAEDERFEFKETGTGKLVTITQGGVSTKFPIAFASGENWRLTQIFGPRACQIAPNTGQIGQENVEIGVDCGTPPGKALLSGIFAARPGTTIELQVNNAETLTLTAANDGNDHYSPNPFNFKTLFPIGGSWRVTIKTPPIGQKCVIYSTVRDSFMIGEGEIYENANNLRIGCDMGTELVSRSADNNSFGTFYDSNSPVIGGQGVEEGRYVAFVSSAPGLGGSLGKHRQIIWRDRNTGVTKVISISPGGEEGNQDSYAPSISADGRSVAFESYSTNLVGNDTNERRDVFVWRENTGKVERVSTGQGGVEGDYESLEPTISGDGNLIAFSSNARNFIPKQEVSGANVYLKDMRSGGIQLISIDEKTKKGGGGSNPSISEDGSRIAFYNYAPLTADDKNDIWDIYLWQRGMPKLKRVSMSNDGTERNQGTESSSRVVAPTISGNGVFVTFATTATNLSPEDTNNVQDVFVAAVELGTVRRLSMSKDGRQSDLDSPIGQGEKIAISHDGKWVGFSTNATNLGGNILMVNQFSNEVRVISAAIGPSVGPPAISRNGNYIVFGSGNRLDERFQSTGIFGVYTNLTRCRFCPE